MRARMKDARDRVQKSQADIAHLLGVSLAAYQKMEQRGSLWADYIEPFAGATDSDPWFIRTGRNDRQPANVSEPPLRRIK